MYGAGYISFTIIHTYQKPDSVCVDC